MQQSWRGDLLLLEITGDVHALLEGSRASARVIGEDEERGFLIDWSEGQEQAKALVEEPGSVWFRRAKVLDI
jgi:hypothetical protein